MMYSIKTRKIRRNKIRLHDWSVKEHQERGSDLTSSDYGSFDLPTNILMVSIACHVMVTDIINCFRSWMLFSAPWSLSGMTVSLLTNGDPDEWDWSRSFGLSYSVNEAGIGAGSLSPIPDQITSQKNEQRMEGSIEPRNGKPCFKLSQSGSNWLLNWR